MRLRTARKIVKRMGADLVTGHQYYPESKISEAISRVGCEHATLVIKGSDQFFRTKKGKKARARFTKWFGPAMKAWTGAFDLILGATP